MYKYYYIFINIFFILLILSIIFLRKTAPITIKVIDADTNLPVENVLVFYHFTKTRPVFFIETDNEVIDVKKIKTNNNGEIIIPGKYTFLWLFERLYSKIFFINLDVTENNIYIKNEQDRFNRIESFLILNAFNQNQTINSNVLLNEKIKLINDNYTGTAIYLFYFAIDDKNEQFINNFYEYVYDIRNKNRINITVKLSKNPNVKLQK